MVEVSIFYKSEKTSGLTIRPKKIETVALLTLSWPTSFLTFFLAFSVLWTYPVPNEVALLEVKIGQDRGEKFLANQLQKGRFYILLKPPKLQTFTMAFAIL